MDDWNHLRTLVAVAEIGSLSAAARRLGLSQFTLGRHVEALEAAVGGGVFARHPRGLALTERGRALYAQARAVADEVDAFARRAAADADAPRGSVRVSASEVVAHHVLPSLLAPLLQRWPELGVEVVADDRAADLRRRDADVAIRMFRPTQPDLVARHVADATLGFYASATYLERAAPVAPPIESLLRQHVVIGLDRDEMYLRALNDFGLEICREDFRLRSDAQAMHIEAAVAGVGIVAMQDAIAVRRGLVPVLPEGLVLPPLPVWLVAHTDLRRSQRVRVVWDALAEGLEAFYGARSTLSA